MSSCQSITPANQPTTLGDYPVTSSNIGVPDSQNEATATQALIQSTHGADQVNMNTRLIPSTPKEEFLQLPVHRPTNDKAVPKQRTYLESLVAK